MNLKYKELYKYILLVLMIIFCEFYANAQRKTMEQRLVEVEKKINIYENKILNLNKTALEQVDHNLTLEVRLTDINNRLENIENASKNTSSEIKEKIAFTKYFFLGVLGFFLLLLALLLFIFLYERKLFNKQMQEKIIEFQKKITIVETDQRFIRHNFIKQIEDKTK